MRIDHVQVVMPAGGESAARRFYGRVLRLPEVPKPEALRSRGGCWFRSEQCELHIGVEQQFRAQRKAHPALAVVDVQELAARLEGAGFSVLWDDLLPGVRRFYTADPFGNRIEIVDANTTLRASASSVVRACAALVHDARILMVLHEEGGARYWTLPGGHIEPEETPEEAAIREVREETGIGVDVVRVLWDEELHVGYSDRPNPANRCFLVEAEDAFLQLPRLGVKEDHTAGDLVHAVEWRDLDEMREDVQVARVLSAMGQT